ncbi:ribonuclease Z [Marininema halotolerans]|uniref:Ribonuclease Z n=1 Tax=Marininema halotolerans TaxID=1155944 RepID=A0A1I6NSH4_9BACL|nr:ribonuclease Z [Marininema halotolerans]SFS30897.1 ribonuclease Z [Marininema halotolerans]
MEWIFLGTGAGVPSQERNVSSCALRFTESGGNIWLFDCGEGTQHRILASPVRLSRVDRIFITHLHGDHIFGLPGVLGSRSFQGATTPLTLYGPKGLAEFIEVSLQTSGTHLRYPLTITEVGEGKVFDCKGVTVTVGKLAHGLPSYGYRIEEPDAPGELLVQKLQQEGVPSGPHFGKLKRGEDVLLPDGRHLRSVDYLGPIKRGRHVAYLGDTRPVERGVELAKGVDCLIHEGSFADGCEDHAHRYFHSTSRQAAEIAKRAGAKRLILNHISSRYSASEIEELKAQACEVFPHVDIAADHSVFSIEGEMG